MEEDKFRVCTNVDDWQPPDLDGDRSPFLRRGYGDRLCAAGLFSSGKVVAIDF